MKTVTFSLESCKPPVGKAIFTPPLYFISEGMKAQYRKNDCSDVTHASKCNQIPFS